MALAMLLKPRVLATVLALGREAKRSGAPWERVVEGDVVAARLQAGGKPAKWGLVPEYEVSAEPRWEPDLTAAVRAAGNGSWQPAARVLAETGQDWERRAQRLDALVRGGDDAWLRTWLAKRPRSADAVLCRASWQVRYAWKLRGSARASATSRQQFVDFHQGLVQAEKWTREASELAPQDPTPWQVLITIARGLGYEHDQFAELWDGLVARAPLHRRGHEEALQYWRPHWAGSYPEMIAFADEAAAKSPSLAAVRLEAALESSGEDDDAWRAPAVAEAVDALLAWLEGEGADSPWASSERAYAALALVRAERYAEALEQFRVLGPRADAWVWRRLGDPRTCFLMVRAKACAHTPPLSSDPTKG